MSICACIETSSADTGSSSTNSFGSDASALAMPIRWRWLGFPRFDGHFRNGTGVPGKEPSCQRREPTTRRSSGLKRYACIAPATGRWPRSQPTSESQERACGTRSSGAPSTRRARKGLGACVSPRCARAHSQDVSSPQTYPLELRKLLRVDLLIIDDVALQSLDRPRLRTSTRSSSRVSPIASVRSHGGSVNPPGTCPLLSTYGNGSRAAGPRPCRLHRILATNRSLRSGFGSYYQPTTM